MYSCSCVTLAQVHKIDHIHVHIHCTAAFERLQLSTCMSDSHSETTTRILMECKLIQKPIYWLSVCNVLWGCLKLGSHSIPGGRLCHCLWCWAGSTWSGDRTGHLCGCLCTQLCGGMWQDSVIMHVNASLAPVCTFPFLTLSHSLFLPPSPSL